MRKKKKKSRKIPKYELGTPPTEPQINYARTDATNVAGFPGYEGEYEAPNPNRKEDWIGNALVGSIFAPFTLGRIPGLLKTAAEAYKAYKRPTRSETGSKSAVKVPEELGSDVTHIADRMDKLNKYLEDNSGKITQGKHITKEGNLEKINPKTTPEMENMLQELKNINKAIEDYSKLRPGKNKYGGFIPKAEYGFANQPGVDPYGGAREAVTQGKGATDAIEWGFRKGLPKLIGTVAGPVAGGLVSAAADNAMGSSGLSEKEKADRQARGIGANEMDWQSVAKDGIGAATKGLSNMAPKAGAETFTGEMDPNQAQNLPTDNTAITSDNEVSLPNT